MEVEHLSPVSNFSMFMHSSVFFSSCVRADVKMRKLGDRAGNSPPTPNGHPAINNNP